MKNKKGFTLVELLLALMIAGTLLGIMMSLYTGIMGADSRMSNKRLLTKEASDLMDTIHTAALDYTIDYEEYFNRSTLNFGVGNLGFTSYGNDGSRYYCGSGFNGVASNGTNKIYQWQEANGGCVSGGNQKYLEYSFQHRNLKTGVLNSRCNSGSNMHRGPVAIHPNTGLDYLYLISPDGIERYYFRRVLKVDNGDGKNDKLYTVQMLRLKGYDAGQLHNFSDNNSTGRFDGFIDTWACDYDQGFVCEGGTKPVIGEFRMPSDFNDGRVDITSNKVTVNDFRIDIYPNKDPYLDTQDDNIIDPYIKITITMNLYGKPSYDEITLSSTLSFKNSYFNYPIEIRENVPNDDDVVIQC